MSTTRVAVAAPARACVDAALDIIAAGGNAVDAASAAIVVASATEPGIVSPMSGAFVNIWAPGEDPVVIDGNVEMPGRGRPPEAFGKGIRTVWIDFYGGLTIYTGHGTVATPGMFAALNKANARWGRTPWRELLAPAVHAVRNGYPLGAAAATYLNAGEPLHGYDPQTRAFLLQGTDEMPVAGQIMRSPQLADSLEAIGRGVETLYGGDLGRVIADDMDANNGLITLEDLRSYQAIVRPALRSQLGGWDIATNPPPSIGGPVLTAMLRSLAARRRADSDPAADILAVQRLVLGYRRHCIDPAPDLEKAGHELISLLDERGPDALGVCASSETAHVSVVDSDGMACSITTSSGYSSGITTPGTGLVLNNTLGEPELNTLGMHSMPPGTRMASNMSPTTARHDGGAVLSIGSPGADRITTALLHILGGICLEEQSLQEAIEARRMHIAYDEQGDERVEFEECPSLTKAVADSGLPSVLHRHRSMYFGGAGAAARHDDGRLDAAGDPRRESATGVG